MDSETDGIQVNSVARDCYDHVETCHEAVVFLTRAVRALKETTDRVLLTPKAANSYPWYSLACDAVYAVKKDYGVSSLALVGTTQSLPVWYISRNVGQLALDLLVLHFLILENETFLTEAVSTDADVPPTDKEELNDERSWVARTRKKLLSLL